MTINYFTTMIAIGVVSLSCQRKIPSESGDTECAAPKNTPTSSAKSPAASEQSVEAAANTRDTSGQKISALVAPTTETSRKCQCVATLVSANATSASYHVEVRSKSKSDFRISYFSLTSALANCVIAIPNEPRITIRSLGLRSPISAKRDYRLIPAEKTCQFEITIAPVEWQADGKQVHFETIRGMLEKKFTIGGISQISTTDSDLANPEFVEVTFTTP